MDQMTEVLAELRELRQRVAELEEERASRAQSEERPTRRGMLRLAGAAIVGGAAASLAGAQSAAAATGDMQFGSDNDAVADRTGLTSSHLVATLDVHNTNAIDNDTDFPDSIRGTATGAGTGVHGVIDVGGGFGSWSVWAENQGLGAALVGTGGRTQIYLEPYIDTGTPTGPHGKGELVANSDGVYYCVTSGSPGVWRKLAGSASAGTFHAVTPTRVYDSRVSLSPLFASAPFVSNHRTVSVADGRDNNGNVSVPNLVPAGATAVTANVTVTGTTGIFGYLAINPGGNTVEGASTINWFGPGQTLANGVNLTLNGSRELTVICNGVSDFGYVASTHFIIDVSGYYL